MESDQILVDWKEASRLEEILNLANSRIPFPFLESLCICSPRREFFLDNQSGDIFHEEELKEIDSVSHPRRKEEKQVGKALVKALLSQNEELIRVKPVHFKVLADSHPVELHLNQPGSEAKKVLSSLKASISHSGEYVFAAIANQSIGLDFEVSRELRKGTVEYFTTEKERKWLDLAIEQDQNPSFCTWDYWGLILFTQKEALLKAVGKGIAGGPTQVNLPGLMVGKEFEASYQERRFQMKTLVSEGGILSVALEK